MSSTANAAAGPQDAPAILLVEHDALERTALASYLRECGYRVVEAVSAEEAEAALDQQAPIDIAFIAVDLPGERDGFTLAKALKARAEGLQVLLAATVERAAKLAGELCEDGPHLRKPYEPQALVDWIKRLRVPRTD